jgi:D-alanyl-D-alanine carboxypeptidase
MNKKIFLLICITFVLVFPKNVNSANILPAQQIEILQQEILLLQTLVSSYNLRQTPKAESYLALDLSNNSALFSKNPEKSLPIASVTKLMSAVISLENIALEKQIELIDQMLEPAGQSPVLYSGLKITAENLLKASLVQSSNDAPEALAFSIGKQNFIDLMNKKAKEIGMHNTVFYDVHGLNPNNSSTASDLAKLISYIYKTHPKILDITKNNDFWLPNPNGVLMKFRNVNNFYYLPEFIGGKTGYLPQAKQTIASVFKINQKPVAIIVLYSDNRMADVFSILRQIKTRF